MKTFNPFKNDSNCYLGIPMQLDLITEDNKRSLNNIYIGTPGKGYHIRNFKVEDFNGDLAPAFASIEHYESNDGTKYVRMTY